MKLHQIADDTGGGHATIAQAIRDKEVDQVFTFKLFRFLLAYLPISDNMTLEWGGSKSKQKNQKRRRWRVLLRDDC